MAGKRGEIIALTASLIHSKGYENTKLSDILETAGIGKGQFYHYFASKRELGLAVLDYIFANWNQRLMEDILGSDKDGATKIDEMLDWAIGQQRRNEARCGCVFGNLAVEMSEHDEAFRRKLDAVFETWTARLEPVLADMLAPARADAAELRGMAQAVVAMLEGGILLMKSKQDITVLLNIAGQIKFLIGSFVRQHRPCGPQNNWGE